MKAGAQVLIANNLPLTAMTRLLTRKPYRDQLLTNVKNDDVVDYFIDRYDEWSEKDAPQMRESTLSRIFLMTDSNVLKYSLGQADNALDFRQLMDDGICVIYNLSQIQDEDAQRLLGCLLTRGYELGAMSRFDTLSQDLRRQHQLILDEFHNFAANSEEGLSSMLSQTRKCEVFLTMAHQTFSQASAGMRGALQNIGVRIAFRVGHDDADYLSRMLGFVDPQLIKAEPLKNKDDEARTHPVFLELQAQWNAWTKHLEDMPARQAYVKIAGVPSSAHVKMVPVPKASIDGEKLAEVKSVYRQQLMRKQDEAVKIASQLKSEKIASEPLTDGKSALEW